MLASWCPAWAMRRCTYHPGPGAPGCAGNAGCQVALQDSGQGPGEPRGLTYCKVGCSLALNRSGDTVFSGLEKPSSRSFSEIISSVSDVKIQPWRSVRDRPGLPVRWRCGASTRTPGPLRPTGEALGATGPSRPTEAGALGAGLSRPTGGQQGPPPRPSCASIKVHEHLRSSRCHSAQREPHVPCD